MTILTDGIRSPYCGANWVIRPIRRRVSTPATERKALSNQRAAPASPEQVASAVGDPRSRRVRRAGTGVLFDDRYRVSRAALIPREVVRERSKFVRYTNSHKFMLADEVWKDGHVKDVTKELQAAESRVRGMAGARGAGSGRRVDTVNQQPRPAVSVRDTSTRLDRKIRQLNRLGDVA